MVEANNPTLPRNAYPNPTEQEIRKMFAACIASFTDKNAIRLLYLTDSGWRNIERFIRDRLRIPTKVPAQEDIINVNTREVMLKKGEMMLPYHFDKLLENDRYIQDTVASMMVKFKDDFFPIESVEGILRTKKPNPFIGNHSLDFVYGEEPEEVNCLNWPDTYELMNKAVRHEMSFLLTDKTAWKGEEHIKWNVHTSKDYLEQKKAFEQGPGPAKRKRGGIKNATNPTIEFRLQNVEAEIIYDDGKTSKMFVRDMFPDSEREGILLAINLNPKWHLIEFQRLSAFIDNIQWTGRQGRWHLIWEGVVPGARPLAVTEEMGLATMIKRCQEAKAAIKMTLNKGSIPEAAQGKWGAPILI